MRKFVALLVAASSLTFSTHAAAATVVYTITGTGSGFLGSGTFNSAAFTFTLTGDTSNVTGNPGDQINNPLSSAAFMISGLGSGSFGLSTRFGQYGNAVFFSRSSGTDLFDFFSPIRDLRTTFGPTPGVDVFALNQFQQVATTAGALSFNAATNVAFSATVGEISAAVPEPTTWLTMIIGFGAIGFGMRREQSHAVHCSC